MLRILQNIIWQFGDKIIRIGGGLFVGVWLARYLGPVQFGLLSYALALVALFAPLAGLGLNNIVVRDVVNKPALVQSYINTSIVMQFFAALIAFFTSILAVVTLRGGEEESWQLVMVICSTLFFKSTDPVRYWFEAILQSRYYVLVDNLAFGIVLLLRTLLIYFEFPLLAFAWLILLESAFSALGLAWVYQRRGMTLKLSQSSCSVAKQLILDSWPLVFSGLAVMIYMRIDQVMIGHYLGDYSVGVYSAALRISEAWYFIPMIIASSLYPSMIRAKKIGESDYYIKLGRFYELMLFVSLLVAVPVSFYADSIIKIIYGEGYADAGQVLALHIWCGVFASLGVASSQWYIIEGLQLLSFARTAVGALINIALNFILIPAYGVVGAAIATLIAQIISAYVFDLMFASTRKQFGIKTRSFFFIELVRVACKK